MKARLSALCCAMTLLLAACGSASQAPAQPSAIDIGFAQHMSLHHDQAVLLVRLFLHQHDTALQDFARSMHDAQLLELGQMRGWLALWDQPRAPSDLSMDWMLVGSRPPDAALRAYLLACQQAPSGMPGLASQAQINAMLAAQGTARDEHFLRLMRQHHEGGLPMLQFVAREAVLPPVRQLAQRMLSEQTRESVSMAAALSRLP